MASKVCDTRDLDRPYYRKLAEEYILLSNDGTPGWRDNNHVFRLWEYAHSYQALDLDKARRFCDIGSENSLWPVFIKKRHPELQVVCVDPNTNGRLAARAELHGTELDIQSRYFGPGLGQFDRIACVSVLEHVASDEDVFLIRKLAEALKPGGILVVTVDYGPEDVGWPLRTENVMGGGRMYGPEQIWSRIIEPSGLRLVGEERKFPFRPLDNEIPGIDPLYVSYTSICLVLVKD